MKRIGKYLGAGGVLLFATALTGMLAQRSQERAIAGMWQGLDTQSDGMLFDDGMVAGLPEPAQRWLLHAIAPGTPLSRTAVLAMHGTIALREGEEPWLMTAEQILAPPHGFIWKARVGSGLLRIRGFDRYVNASGEMRWWMFGVLPVVTAAGPDVSRSAAGRLAGEGAMVPASLLPAFGTRWEPVDGNIARAIMDVDGEEVSFTLDVAADGRLRRVVIDRWNGDPKNGPVGFLPFVVEFEGERVFGGYTVPAHLRAGWERDGVVRVFFDAEVSDVVYH